MLSLERADETHAKEVAGEFLERGEAFQRVLPSRDAACGPGRLLLNVGHLLQVADVLADATDTECAPTYSVCMMRVRAA